MTYRIDTNHPRITMDTNAMAVEQAVAAFLDAIGVTTQAQWTAWVANASTADLDAYDKVKATAELSIQAVE